MIFKQFVLESLGQASYLVGSEEAGEALVLDARRDTQTYFDAAREKGLRIAYAADTHQHNDYLTGICELSTRGDDVAILAGARAELGYESRPLADGERLEMGEVVFEVLETPGHTPEHISILVTDRSRGDEPVLLLSGGALLVGDVARPDLLGGEEEARQAAARLCATLQNKILTLADHVQVYPTHVAGSLCGGSIGSRFSTTIGYERRMNQMLASLDASERFVRQCLDLEALPAVPPYWPRMRRENRRGPAPLGVLCEPPPLPPSDFEKRAADGAWIVDCRAPEAYGGGHVPRAINVGGGSSFPTWAGSVLPPDAPLLLVLDDATTLWDRCWDLLRIGYDLPVGWLRGGMMTWRTAGKPIERLRQWTVHELQEQREKRRDLVVLDVRQPKEWAAGRIPGAVFITGAELSRRIDEVPTDRPVATICGSGYRSSVAASLLLHSGRKDVFNVLGGMAAWSAAGLPRNDTAVPD